MKGQCLTRTCGMFNSVKRKFQIAWSDGPSNKTNRPSKFPKGAILRFDEQTKP